MDFSHIQFNEGNLNESKSIIILRLRNVKYENIIHTHDKIDRCCKSSDLYQDIQNLVPTSMDNIERISCDITKESFLRNYVKKRQPVILEACQKNWPAKKWTFKGIFKLCFIFNV